MKIDSKPKRILAMIGIGGGACAVVLCNRGATEIHWYTYRWYSFLCVDVVRWEVVVVVFLPHKNFIWE